MAKIVSVSKAKRLYEILKKEIVGGKYQDGDKLPSIRELAQNYELSTNTVNTVFAMLANDGLAVIREGSGTYVHFGGQRASMIGVMLFDFSTGLNVEADILRYIQQNLPRSYYLSLMDSTRDYDTFCYGLEQLISMGAEGLLIQPPKAMPSERNAERIRGLLQGRHAVMINRTIEGLGADLYSMNLGKGMEKAFEYLVMSGKMRTAIVLHDDFKFRQEELQAYTRHCAAYGIPPQQGYLLEMEGDIAGTIRQVAAILPEIDSLIAPDVVLMQLREVIAGDGRPIPQALSLIGINDGMYARTFTPPLTSIAFPVEKIGRHAIHKLLQRMEGHTDDPYRQTNFVPEFIIRNT